MSDLTIEVKTSKSSMGEIRPALDSALKESFPGGMLKWHWEEDVMHLSGPGAKATIVLEDGRLVGRAHLKPPANLMKPVIEQKIAAVLKKVAGHLCPPGREPVPATPSPYSALLRHAELASEEPWLFRSEGLDWRWTTWGDLARQATAWASHLAGHPPASRFAFPYRPGPEAISLDLGIMGAGLVSVPVSGEPVPEPEVPHPRPSSPRPSSPAPSQPPSPGEEGEQQGRHSRVPLSRGGGWGGRERGRGEGLGRGPSEAGSAPRERSLGGAVVLIEGSPVELGTAEIMGIADRVQAEIAPARRAGEREIVVLGGPLEMPEERAMLSWATVTGAAVALEPSPGLRIATAAWVRPTVFHGTAEEMAVLRAWVAKKKRRGLPFGRLRTLLVTGGELGEKEAAFWREWGVKLGRVGAP